MGSDCRGTVWRGGSGCFNPRSPHGERQNTATRPIEVGGFNPRSPHGERRLEFNRANEIHQVSIHAPRMGSDERNTPTQSSTGAFQSTLPAWGATSEAPEFMMVMSSFNPRSPHGERPQRIVAILTLTIVSIHAPRMGSDLRKQRRKASNPQFQSTLPAWGATVSRKHLHRYVNVSIHAPRMGSDKSTHRLLTPLSMFQSTLPAWGATNLPSRESN